MSAQNAEKKKVGHREHAKQQKRVLRHQICVMHHCSVRVKPLSLYQVLKVFEILCFNIVKQWVPSTFQWGSVSSIANDWDMEGEVENSDKIENSDNGKVRFY